MSSAWEDLTVLDFLDIIDSEKWLVGVNKRGPRHNHVITEFVLK